MRGLLDELLIDNPATTFLWFGARLRIYNQTDELLSKSQAAVSMQSAFMNYIQKQKMQFIKVGYLRARESEPCPECGQQTWKLTEKGVDVGMAVRMLTEADKDTELVIVSSDTDFVPALKATKKLGVKLMYIRFENRPISALSRLSDATRTITLPLIQKYHQNTGPMRRPSVSQKS